MPREVILSLPVITIKVVDKVAKQLLKTLQLYESSRVSETPRKTDNNDYITWDLQGHLHQYFRIRKIRGE